MKRNIYLFVTALVAMTLVSCEEKSGYKPGDNNAPIPDSIPVMADPDPTPDPEGVNIPAGTINVNEAVSIGKKLTAGTSTPNPYFIKGWVTRFNEDARNSSKPDWESSFKQYGNDYVYLSARSDGQGVKEFYCYRVLGRGGAKLPNHDVLQIGDFVVIKCKIQNYSGTIENDGTCSIEVSTNDAFNEAFPIPDTIHATCAQAKDSALALPNNGTSKDIYVVEGYVQSDGYNAVSKGQQTFWIDDKVKGSKVFESYYCNVPNGEAVPVGAKVHLIGHLTRYNSTPEIKNGDVEIIELPEE